MNDSSSSRGGLSIRERLPPRQASAEPSGSGESLYHAALAPGSTVFGRLETTRGVKMLRILNQRLVACEDRLSDFLRKEVPARLASLILDFSEHQGVVTANGGRMIPTRYTHQQLASMVRSNREAVTRAFPKLRDAGAVKMRDRYIYITDVDALHHLA